MAARRMYPFALMMLFISQIDGASVRAIKGTSTSQQTNGRISQSDCLTGLNKTNVNETSRAGRRSSGPDDKALTTLFAGQMQFSLDLFKTVFNSGKTASGKKENIFVSPMSIYSSLLLAYFGSNNRTEEQLAQVLGFKDMDKIGAIQAYKLVKFTRQLMRVAGLVTYEFEIANRVYFDKGENIRQCMKEILSEDLEMLDFSFKPDESRNWINRWVENITHNRIKDFATPDVINSNTRMALVNAAYFKGLWAAQFSPNETRQNSFFSDGKEGVANLMFRNGRYRAALSEELQASLLELPYQGEDVSFYILLPEEEGSLEETVSRLSLDVLRDVMGHTLPTPLEVGIPKFRMEQTLSLRRTLVKLGLTDLFDAFSADLSGFTGTQGLNVDSATHKAFIEVNEEGSEAAAATALVDLRMARPLFGKNFICNRPFLFFIYDNLSESILFMGTYRNPK